ncbi:MAG: hypothetical protein KGJ62_01755 [Armatimonadetes bacterium]|nr:hypothetical protein [Armatimonadota bacterium]MDE2205503.1 hypothetical protein [Armatimonadota bacterium]
MKSKNGATRSDPGLQEGDEPGCWRRDGRAAAAEATADAEPRGAYRYQQLHSSETACLFRYPDSGTYAGFASSVQEGCLAVFCTRELAAAELAENPELAGAVAELMTISDVAKVAEQHFGGRYVLLLNRGWYPDERGGGLSEGVGEVGSPLS